MSILNAHLINCYQNLTSLLFPKHYKRKKNRFSRRNLYLNFQNIFSLVLCIYISTKKSPQNNTIIKIKKYFFFNKIIEFETLTLLDAFVAIVIFFQICCCFWFYGFF